MAPQSFTFVEEIETFEKKKEEKNLHVSSQHEDSSRSSICEMIQNFSDRLDRNEVKDKKNSFSTEFLIHHAGSRRYCDDIEEEETLSSDDGNFIYAKEETRRVEDTVDVSYGTDQSEPSGTKEREKEMVAVKIHLTDDDYYGNRANESALFRRENESTLEEERSFRRDQSGRQDSSLALSSDYQHSGLHEEELSLEEEDYYKRPAPSAGTLSSLTETQIRNQESQYKEEEHTHHSHQYQAGPQYVNFTFPRPTVRKHSSFHKNVPKVVRFSEM